ncbi:hypothetical protein ABZ916_39200 [Streptomyces sp. NPDC046853]|uniref:hypothetical protein n=1 Tax=Streptomyces sp. NPDC046853 TaxID=3154920 RepID=UPI0033F64B15
MEIAATSTEYAHVDVTAKIAGTPIALATPPKLAILPASSTDNPQAGDWIEGEWHANTARLLIGPAGGAVQLDPGRYKLWLSFAAGLELPVVKTGFITVY